MKLNNKRTVLVGLAFLSICAFWQMYDNVIPLILRETFHMNESLAGAVMALDNILALFLLPFFGTLSDRCRNQKLGRRTPFILIGTAAAVILMNLLPLLDNGYAENGGRWRFAAFIVVLGGLLVAMGSYRSPAVALMPDVTPKPLRSRANAIINLMGAVGGMLYLGVAAVLYPTDKVKNLVHVNYQPLFLVVSAIMAAAVAVLLLTIREPRLSAENQALEARHPEWNLAEDDGSGHEVLPKPVKRSLGFLLASIALWYIGYNGVTTWFTTYISEIMGEGLGTASRCLLVATAGAIVSYIPIGAVASKVGRRKTILAGCALLAACFFTGFLLTTAFSTLNFAMYIVFALVGLVAWAFNPSFARMSGDFIYNLLTFNFADINSTTFVIHMLFGFFVLIWIPMTHMGHLLFKYFTYHDIRWGDTPTDFSQKNNEKMKQALQFKVSWAADHINGQGTKPWLDIALPISAFD